MKMLQIIPRYVAKDRGLKWYFTGLNCKHGHTEERKTSNGECRQCAKDGHRRRGACKTPEENRKRAREYYAKNKGRVKSNSRRRRKIKSEELKEYHKEYYQRNKKRHYDNGKKWVENNRNRAREISKRWREKNTSKVREDSSLRKSARLRRVLALPDHLEELNEFCISELYQHANDMELLTGDKWHVDHIAPKLGKNISGLHIWYNMRVITAEENLKKGNRFRAHQARK